MTLLTDQRPPPIVVIDGFALSSVGRASLASTRSRRGSRCGSPPPSFFWAIRASASPFSRVTRILVCMAPVYEIGSRGAAGGERRPQRVLWVTPVPPSFDGAGGHLRQAHLLAALAAQADVSVLVSGEIADQRINQTTRSVTELAVREDDWSAKARPLRRLRDLWLATGSAQPREVAAFGPVRRAMTAHVTSFDGDVVIVEYAGLAGLVSRVPRRPGQRWILTLHNVASVMAAQEAAVASGRRQRWLYRRDTAKARRWEQKAVVGYDRLIVVSNEDRQAMGSPPSTTVIPNGVDGRRFSPTPLSKTPVVVFTGALYTGPNVDGVRWFCSEVLPLVRAQVPDVTVLVVGARPPAAVRELSAVTGVRVEADVASTVPWLGAARVAVVPLRVGSGTRLKALEALAAGRPVVGTTIGLAGLDLVDGRHALVADDPASFAAAVVRLLRDDDLADHLVVEGRRLVEDRYGWAGIADCFVDVVLDERAR